MKIKKEKKFSHIDFTKHECLSLLHWILWNKKEYYYSKKINPEILESQVDTNINTSVNETKILSLSLLSVIVMVIIPLLADILKFSNTEAVTRIMAYLLMISLFLIYVFLLFRLFDRFFLPPISIRAGYSLDILIKFRESLGENVPEYRKKNLRKILQYISDKLEELYQKRDQKHGFDRNIDSTLLGLSQLFKRDGRLTIFFEGANTNEIKNIIPILSNISKALKENTLNTIITYYYSLNSSLDKSVFLNQIEVSQKKKNRIVLRAYKLYSYCKDHSDKIINLPNYIEKCVKWFNKFVSLIILIPPVQVGRYYFLYQKLPGYYYLTETMTAWIVIAILFIGPKIIFLMIKHLDDLE